MIFNGKADDITEGARLLYGDIDAVVTVETNPDKLIVSKKNGELKISYSTKNEFFRGLAILADKMNGEAFYIEQERHFNTCGIMADVSRNAVLKTETVKDIIRYMAKMGLNMLMLYTEDTYKMEKYPYFGYMRGAYTKEEIKEIVEYAEIFGIEIIPCIQTLAHLQKTLRWPYAAEMKDTQDILLIGEEKTYEFIEEMIKTSRECYKTNKIHIGMDEAHSVGLGTYLARNGYRDRFTILTEHLDRVISICEKYDFDPMMWSDMFFRINSKTGDYYDTEAEITQENIEKIPENISLVYWDYDTRPAEDYDKMVSLHQKLGKDILFAGGAWTWNGVAINYNKAFNCTNAGLASCVKNNIKDVFVTVWGDNGEECSIYTSLLAMQLYAEYNYTGEYDKEELSQMFRICTGYDAESFWCFDVDGIEENKELANISKWVLYQDIMLGMFDKHYEHIDLKAHYKNYLDKINSVNCEGQLEYLFDYQKQLIKVLYEKCDVGLNITRAYKNNDRAQLEYEIEHISRIREEVKKLHKLAGEIWYRNNKPFGYEVLDSRLGGLESACNRAKDRLLAYLNGEVDSLPELEEEKLPFNGSGWSPHVYVISSCADWIESPSNF